MITGKPDLARRHLLSGITATAAEVTFAPRSPAVLFDQPQLMIVLNIVCAAPGVGGEIIPFSPFIRLQDGKGHVYDVFRNSSGVMVLAVDGDLIQCVLQAVTS